MQQRQGSDGVGGSVEDQLGPLRAAGVFQRNYFHAGARDQAGQFFNLGHRCVRRFEGTNPGVALDVEAEVAGSDGMSGGERGATNDVLHVFRNDLFVADAVLHGADSAVRVESSGNLRDGATGVDGFGGNDAIVTARKFLGIAGGVQFGSEIGGSGNAQTAIADGFDVIFPDVVGPDFGLALLGEVRGEEAADCAATDDTDLQQARTPNSEIYEVRGRIAEVKNCHRWN
jgi:hypothetical protein